MAEINPPAWLQAGSYPARTDRLSAVTSLLSYAGYAADEATPLRPRQGMRPSYQGYQLKARAAATPNMTVIISGGMCFVDNHDLNGYGTYVLINDADKTVAISAAGGAGQFRKDTVVFSVYDAETAGAANSCQIEVIQGPYAASAGATVRGSLPANCVVICDIAIAPSQTSVTSGNLTDGRAFTVALGGIGAYPSNGTPDHPHPGMVMYQTDLDKFIYGKSDGSKADFYPAAGAIGGPPLTAYKSADEPISNATLQDDDALFLNLAANATYIIDGWFVYNGQTFATGPGDLKITWLIPAGSTFRWTRNGAPSNNSNALDTVVTDEAAIRVLGTFGTGTDVSASPRGRIVTVGTAGQLKLRWAQNASTGTATIMRAGSYLRATRVA